MFASPDPLDGVGWPMTLGDMIGLHARYRPADLAMIADRRETTYAELDEQSDRAAAALAAWGVGQGDRIAVLSRNSGDYVALYYAVAKLGAILVPLNSWQRPGEHRGVLADAQPSVLFCEPRSRAALEEAALPDYEGRIVMLEPTDDAVGSGDLPALRDAMAAAGPTPHAEVGPEIPHLILYTSGTTGRPKGTVIPQGRTTRGAQAIAGALRIVETDRFLNFYPPFHAGNWDNMVIYHAMGAAQVLLPAFDAGDSLRAIEEHQVTVIDVIPSMLQSLLDHPDASAEGTRSLRLMYYAAYDPNDLVQRARSLFGTAGGRELDIVQTYGFSESAPWVTCCQADDLKARPNSVGRPLVGMQLALLDPEGTEVPRGQVGEICVRGPHMTAYWNNPAETEAAFRHGWLHSGDLGVLDDDGFLSIAGRAKDVVRSGGHNIYAREVELHLLEHPVVEEVAVIGVPDAVYEESVLAVVVPGQPVDPASVGELTAELQQFVRARSAGYNVPKLIEFVETLPRNSMGKLGTDALRAQYGGRYGEVFERPADRKETPA
jgi:acyl-CoA synthetase (AMP-forming)/AMP-acid ligase II